ncbi:hypothetical protein [Gemmobacter serpentinus]|uniref:hypothetical protein n=1 Tax=Gemmobacter serpentinus TaxID=2652247 RepID=UPI00124EFEF9|nr:hypothetical protein [Gemmobacter serpentinus]
MTFIVHTLSFIVHRSSFIVHRSSFIVHRSSFIVYCLLFIVYCPLMILHPSSFILHPSSFILHPSSFILHPSSFAVCCSYFILHSQSLILREFQPSLSHLLVVCVGIYGSGSSNGRKSGAGRALAGLPRGWWRLVRRRVLAPFSAALREWGLCVPIARLVDLAERLLLGSRLKALGPGRVGRPGLISLRRSPQLNCSPSQFSAREAFSLRLSVATVGKMRQTAMERWQEMQVVNKMGSLSL